jgi:hypothetical protein
MMGKSTRPDKHRCPQGRLRTAHARIAVLAGMIYSAQRTFSGLPDISPAIWYPARRRSNGNQDNHDNQSKRKDRCPGMECASS